VRSKQTHPCLANQAGLIPFKEGPFETSSYFSAA